MSLTSSPVSALQTAAEATASATAQISAAFPSPPTDGIDIVGPLRIGFYGLAIGLGILVAYFVSSRLWKSRGGSPENVFDALIWAVLLGIVGGRLYHVITSPDAYFGENGDLSLIPQVWLGGLGIVGAVALGAVGVWFACRRYGMKFGAFADVIVPGVILAQAIGRWGNYFNQELYGAPTNLPWGLAIDTTQRHQAPPLGASESTLYHPTFLYESIWNLIGFFLLIALYRRFAVKQGLLTWTYVAYYSLGRFWIESLRVDEMNKSTQWINIFGIEWRLNMWMSVFLFLLALSMLIWLWSRRPRTEAALAEEMEIYRPGQGPRGSEDHAAPAADSRTGETAGEAPLETADVSAQPGDAAAQPGAGTAATGVTTGATTADTPGVTTTDTPADSTAPGAVDSGEPGADPAGSTETDSPRS
ncbi:prolipoprotein diacylglyceryl transferase [Nesterenkonia sp. AY15]|uniref:prolipoprotein diacylglyceryl transferase n=1 Tax=Nesterenkonia sp. AY15 TaxID=2901139 RepID=UPI001F4D199E|nr:prolipoprotein diacylglyceryl transferase [Nesterenkonia sp. AY15]